MKGECSDSRGNCKLGSDDGLPVQCVGDWVPRVKHEIVGDFIAASYGARAKFLGPNGGGAYFIDLFAGPGRARVRDGGSGTFIDGSPLLALKHERAPFTKVIAAELFDENVQALRARTSAYADRIEIVPGDCNATIDALLAKVPPHALNLALVDPYGLRGLNFSTLEALAKRKRMDLIVHFPTGDIKRNFLLRETPLWITEFIGTKTWRERVTAPEKVELLIPILREQLTTLGYTGADVRAAPVRNSLGVPMYHLVFASKSKFADKLWRSVTKRLPDEQPTLFS